MPFEQVEIVLPDGQKQGPFVWATLTQWARQQSLPSSAVLIDTATGQQRAVSSFPELMSLVHQAGNPYKAPQGLPPASGDDPVSYVIPYKNAPALISYYLGIFSLLACIPLVGLLGVVMGIAALVLGIKGLKLAAANPQAHGRAHAWIGIICGPICALVGLLINVTFIIGMLSSMAGH